VRGLIVPSSPRLRYTRTGWIESTLPWLFPRRRYAIRMSWPRRLSAKKERQEEREHHAEEDRGRQWEIEGKIAPLNIDIPGEPAQPWNSSGQEEYGPEDHQEEPEDDQPFANIVDAHEFAAPLGDRRRLKAPGKAGHREAEPRVRQLPRNGPAQDKISSTPETGHAVLPAARAPRHGAPA